MEIFGQKNYVLHKDKKLSGAKYRSQYPHIRKPLYCSKAYNSSKPTVLVLSPFGLQTDYLVGNLIKAKSQFMYLNLDELVKKGQIAFEAHTQKFTISYGSLKIELNKVKSIYVDYFDLQEVFYFRRSDFNLKEQIFIRRWLYLLSLMETLFINASWYPAKPSHMTFEKQNKIAELVMAKREGLKVPKSLLSNDYKVIQKFIQSHKSILKDSGLKAFYSKRSLSKFQSSYVGANLKAQAASLAPIELQEHIEKKADVRSYLVGEKIYSVCIQAKSRKPKELDWKGREKDYEFKPFQLPARVEKKIISFAKKQKYSLCSFDLLLTKSDEIIFLEMNRPGQWYFAQMLSGIQLSLKIVEQLIR